MAHMQPNGGRAERSDSDELASTRPMVLVISLMVSPGGRVIHGDVFEPDTRRAGRFVGLDGLNGIVRGWLRESAGPVARSGADGEAAR